MWSSTARTNSEVAVQVEAQSIYDSVGGESAYQSMVQWAASNLSQDEINSYNEVTNGGSAAAVKFAVEALNNRYKAAEGYEAPMVTGSKSAPRVQGYRTTRSWWQISGILDMNETQHSALTLKKSSPGAQTCSD